ncbi:MAG: PmoA family protein [Luteolibacter sp.]
MRTSYKASAFTLLTSFSILAAAFAEPGYDIRDDKKLKQLDVMQAGKLVGRYFYDYDNSSGQRRDDTFKTFLQVYNPAGDLAITKALGGEFSHHRGIFIGWNKVTIDGESFDCWHGHGGAQVHQEFSKVRAEKGKGSFTSRLLWEKGKNGPPVIEETRTMTFVPAPSPAYVMLDFTSTLKALNGKTVILDGDPEHAGIQFRAAKELDRTKTRYLYPQKNADAHRDQDYPWVACSYVLGEKTYSVVYLNHPENPKETKYSAYRDYARFGAFFKTTLEEDQERTLKVRFIVLESPLPPAEWVQKQYNTYTGKKDATPETTEKGPT